MLTKLGYQGLLDLDLRLDRRDGRYKLLDFNPRLGAQFRLFATTGGLDLATAAYLDLASEPSEAQISAFTRSPLCAAPRGRVMRSGASAWCSPFTMSLLINMFDAFRSRCESER